MWSWDTWCRAVVGEGSLELDSLAYRHQHVAIWPFPSFILLCVTLQVLLIGLEYSGRISCGLTTPGHHRQRASIPSPGKCWRIWAFISSPGVLSTPAPVYRSRHVGDGWDFHWDDGRTNGDGACSRYWAWTPGGRFWRGGAADCGNPRGDDNWAVAWWIGARGIVGSRIKCLTWTRAYSKRAQVKKRLWRRNETSLSHITSCYSVGVIYTCRGGRIRSCVNGRRGIGPCRVGPRSRVRSLCAGQTGCGGRSFALEHESVGLTDVTVPGDGGGFIKVWLLLWLLIPSHGEIIIVWNYKTQTQRLTVYWQGKWLSSIWFCEKKSYLVRELCPQSSRVC